MSQEQVNGHAHQEPPVDVAKRAEAQVDGILTPIIGNTINGILVTLQGIHVEHVLRGVARLTGRTLGMILRTSTLPQILTMRAALKEEFAKGLDSVQPQPQPSFHQHNRPPRG